MAYEAPRLFSRNPGAQYGALWEPKGKRIIFHVERDKKFGGGQLIVSKSTCLHSSSLNKYIFFESRKVRVIFCAS